MNTYGLCFIYIYKKKKSKIMLCSLRYTAAYMLFFYEATVVVSNEVSLGFVFAVFDLGTRCTLVKWM